MGLTATGFTRRTYQEILDGKIQKARELFGEDIDVSDQQPLGKILRIDAYDLAMAEEEAEAIYYARFPNTASGYSLDRLLIFGDITRNPAEAARYTVAVTGEAGYVIEAGFLVSTETELTFYCTQDTTIGTNGTCTIEVACTETGTIGNVNASAINTVTNPNVSITAVEGTACLSPGRDTENDVDLRKRLAAAISGAGSGNENAIRAALLRVPTVQYAAVISNDEDEADAEGRPPHTFECYVLGGDDYEQEIAEAIFAKRPIGIKTEGEKSVNIVDASGTTKTIRYSPAQKVMITAAIEIKTKSTFPADGIAQIQANVANHINGLGIGESLTRTSLYGDIHKVTGVADVTSIELSTDGGSTYSSNNVTVPKYGVAVCAAVNVEVVA